MKCVSLFFQRIASLTRPVPLSPSHRAAVRLNENVFISLLLFFVNPDYVCGLSQTLFVKLKILKQNVLRDNCCTVFVSSIFVYVFF